MPDEHQDVLSVAAAARQIVALREHLDPRAARDEHEAVRLAGAQVALEAVLTILARVPAAAAVLGGEHQAALAVARGTGENTVVALHPTSED